MAIKVYDFNKSAFLTRVEAEARWEVAGMAERNLLAVSIKHTEYKWKFGMPCVLWGRRTKDGEKRSFGGYTLYPANAELYSLEDWQTSGYGSGDICKVDEPVKMEIGFCKRWKQYDTVLVRYDDYITFCKAANLPEAAQREEGQ